MACPSCNAYTPPGSSFCPECGYDLRVKHFPTPFIEKQSLEKPSEENEVPSPHIGQSHTPTANLKKNENRKIPVPKPEHHAKKPGFDPVSSATAGYGGAEEGQKKKASQNALPDARLVSIQKDGSDGKIYPISTPRFDVGRLEGDLILDDPYLSPRHMRLDLEQDRAWLFDLSSLNGIYLRLHAPYTLIHRDMVLVGQQVYRVEIMADSELPLGPASEHGTFVFGTPENARFARLVQYSTEGVGRNIHYLHKNETTIGRETADIVVTDDPFLSRRHMTFNYDRQERQLTCVDMGSANGSFVRMRARTSIRSGDEFRVGKHLFRFMATFKDT